MSSQENTAPISLPSAQPDIAPVAPIPAAAKLASPEAEKRAMGALLSHPEAMITHRAELPDEKEFTVTACRAAMRGMVALSEKGVDFDYRAVALQVFHHDNRARISLLRGYDNLSEAESLQVIEHAFVDLIRHGAMDQASLPANLAMVRDMATRRMMVDAARDLENAAYDKEAATDSVVNTFAGQLVVLHSRSPKLQAGTADEGMTALDADLDALDAGTKVDVCVSTGITMLDQAIGGGMIPGVTTVAALTGNGKTTLAYHTILTACRQGHVVVLASTENDRDTVHRELLAIEAGVPAAAIRTGAFRRADPAGYQRAKQSIAAMKLYVSHYDDSNGMPFDTLETAIHIARLKYGRVDLVVVDWLQDMQVPANIASVKEAEKLVQTKLTYIMPRMKQLGKSENVAILGTAQLTKGAISGGLELEYIAGSQEIARRSEAVIMVGLASTHDRTAQDKNKFLIKVGKKRSQGDYPYFDNHFRLDPVERRIKTILGEPVHPAQFRPVIVTADDMPADLYPSTNADDESMVDF